MIYKDCGWGKVNYTPYFYKGRTCKQCKYCGTISVLDKNNDVIYAGGTIHNGCYYCGAPFEDQPNKRSVLS